MAHCPKHIWECRDCFEQFDNRNEAKFCHGDEGKIYVCEICDRDHGSEDDAKKCCVQTREKVETFGGEGEPRTNPIMSHPATPNGLQRNASATTNTLRRDVGNVAKPAGSQVCARPDVKPPIYLGSPRKDCPKCSIAQRLGTVISCSCMKR